jgi:FkbM family methyltransferase
MLATCPPAHCLFQIPETLSIPASPEILWYDYPKFLHSKVLKSKGVFVDLGCYGWNWSGFFLGKNRVVGVDPIEKTCPAGAELFNGLIGPVCGNVDLQITTDTTSSTVKFTEAAGSLEAKTAPRKEVVSVPMITLDKLCNLFSIDQISVLKLNIEGSEFEFLISLLPRHFDKIEQIAAGFHEVGSVFSSAQTKAVLSYLSNWYWIIPTLKDCWYLLVHKKSSLDDLGLSKDAILQPEGSVAWSSPLL